MWFEKLSGFKEENPEQVRKNFTLEGNKLVSKVNGCEFVYGALSTPTLGELKQIASSIGIYKSKISISEAVGDIQKFHKLKENNGAFFQAASQFNLLEMVSPMVTPERGVGIYENDFTQGPACAIACGAGTIYRNYFVEINGKIGQTSTNQIDCLKDISIELKNKEYYLWEMSNGYVLSNSEGLKNITKQITSKNKKEYERLKEKLRIGIQWDTEVTLEGTNNYVTQAYCSALPVAYSHVDTEYWETFARLILEATYEATFYSALINYEKTGKNKLFLTLVGGGAFGNKTEWILDAIKHSLILFSNTPLDVQIVSFSSSNPHINKLIDKLS